MVYERFTAAIRGEGWLIPILPAARQRLPDRAEQFLAEAGLSRPVQGHTDPGAASFFPGRRRSLRQGKCDDADRSRRRRAPLPHPSWQISGGRGAHAFNLAGIEGRKDPNYIDGLVLLFRNLMPEIQPKISATPAPRHAPARAPNNMLLSIPSVPATPIARANKDRKAT